MGLEYRESIPDGGNGLSELARQAEAKKKAMDMPEKKTVTNQPCMEGTKAGVYSGDWLSGGKNKLNNPGGGQGTLTFSDGSGVLEGKWNEFGGLYGGTLKLTGKNEIKITQCYYDGQKNNFLRLEGSMNINGANCRVEVGKDFKIKKVTYGKTSVELSYHNGKTYLDGSKRIQKLGSGIKGEVAAYWIAKCVDIVENSGYELDRFESLGDTLQANYEDKFLDTDLLRNCTRKFGVDAGTLAKWLNASRTDFGI